MSVFNPRFFENFDKLMRPLDCPASTVGTSTVDRAHATTFQRSCYYANGLFWVWYTDGTNLGYRTSSDGLSWSAFNAVRTADNAYHFSIWFNGTYVHYAYTPNTSGCALYYRRGTPNSDGTITWSAPEQTAVAGSTGVHPQYPFVSVDSEGYPFIGYSRYAEYVYTSTPCVTKSSTNDGTWTTDTGFPYELRGASSGDFGVEVIPLNSTRMYAFYFMDFEVVRGRLWDGSSWGAEETASSSAARYTNFYSAVAEGDDVHLVFLKDVTWDIIYVKRTYGVGWGAEVTVQASTLETVGPTLGIDTSTGNLYCFWGGSPTADHIYYKKCVAGTWDASPTDWIDETTDDLTYESRLIAFYKDYGGYIGLAYMTLTVSPYNVRFDFLTMPPAYPYRKIRHTLQF